MRTTAEKNTSTVVNNNQHFFKKAEGKHPSGGSSFFTPANTIQAKLTVGQPDDVYEKEADAVADQVLQGGAPSKTFFQPVSSPAIQSKCAECEQEEQDKVQRKPAISPLQSNGAAHTPVASAPVSAAIESSKGNGQYLPSETRLFMQERMGVDFKNVTIHNDATAVRLSRDLQAKAFTVGNDIYFNEGEFAPETDQGKHLLAHELTHVVQQTGGAESVQRDLAVDVPDPDAVPAVLTPEQIAEAIAFNQRVVRDAWEIEQLRDVLGVSAQPAVVDEDFVEAVLAYQAVNSIAQDGKIGPVTASRISREMRAEARFLGRAEGRELRRGARRMDNRSFTITVTHAATNLSTRGSAEYGVRWGVPDNTANGWIIQHVTFNGNVTDCAGNAVASNNAGLNYWEGWQVVNGQVSIGFAGGGTHSQDTFRTINENPNTRGTVSITGRVSFMPDFNLTMPPWGNTVPAAGSLPTLTVAPPGWSDASARAHTMVVTYNDCVAPATQTVRSTP